MFSRRLKTAYLFLEGLHSFATVTYFYYLYFFMRKEFGFENKANLMLAALSGGSYALFAWMGGRFAQKFGYFKALKLGFGIMLVALATGWQLQTATGEVLIMVATIFGMSFTWPTLEALVSEAEERGGLQHMVGLYNVVWAGTGALANFLGGAMLDKLGPRSVFYVPMAIQLFQLGATVWLESRIPAGTLEAETGSRDRLGANRPEADATVSLPTAGPEPAGLTRTVIGRTAIASGPPPESSLLSPALARSFQRLGWMANPFAYIALNTIIAVVPGIAHRLELSATLAGFCCSVWSWARLGAFFVLWLWPGWHYRFRWLLVSYLGMIGAFATILLVPNLVALVLAQLLFGCSIGLIYYSSLFYSMDTSQTKGEHGGIHESAIGLGNFAGPAVGAAALQFLPGLPRSGAVAVSLLLVGGLAGLLTIWRAGRPGKKTR